MNFEKMSFVIRWFVLTWGCFVVSKNDAEKYFIPDSVLIFVAVVLMGTDVFLCPERILIKILFAFLMFFILLSVFFVSGGIGGGDIKLICLLTYGTGFFATVAGLFFACISALVFCFIKKELCAEKVKRVPFAPFVSASVLLCSLFIKEAA